MIDIYKVKDLINKDEIVNLDDHQLNTYLQNIIIKYISDQDLEFDIVEVKSLSEKLFQSIRGLGIVDQFLMDDQINEIMINSYNQIFIEKNGEITKVNTTFQSDEEYNRIIQKIVSDSGREVNISNPIVNTSLYDGSRVNIILPPIAHNSPCMTIRKFRKDKLSIQNLIDSNTLNKELAYFLRDLVKAKYNIIIGGGTSSGKTTFLNALSEYIPASERLITIEDSRELILQNKSNLISLETRNANNSNKGEITLKELIKNSLRMRPDRIIVGEVRADETLDMLVVMNTGHPGSITSLHSNSTNDSISRLETMVLRSSQNIPIEAVTRMINSAVEILIQLGRTQDGYRRLLEISEIMQDKNGNTIVNGLYKYDFNNDTYIKIGNLINKDKLERLKDYE